MHHGATAEKAKRVAREQFPAFFGAFPPNKPYIYGRHTTHILWTLDKVVKDVERGRCRYLCLCVPFRHGKSDIASRRLPGWALIRNPKWEVILASYGAELAGEMSEDARANYRATAGNWGGAISRMHDKRTSWKTREGGAFFSAGLGGTITGRGGNLIVIDDYLKGRIVAESVAERHKVWESFGSDLMTRLAPVHAVVIVANRWHVNDLVGMIKQKNDPAKEEYDPKFPIFEMLRYPAQDKEGNWLFPERFSEGWYESMKAAMGTYAWNAQAQQNPQPRTGNMLRADLVHFVDEFPENLRFTRGWDIASSKKERASDNPDYTVGTKCAFKDGKLYVADVVRGRWTALKRDQVIKHTAERDGPGTKVKIEVVGGYKDVLEYAKFLLKGKASVSGLTVTADKVARASILEPLFEAGMVYALRGNWSDAWVDELNAFPGGGHDDQVDSLVVAAHDDIMSGGRSNIKSAWGEPEEDNDFDKEFEAAFGDDGDVFDSYKEVD